MGEDVAQRLTQGSAITSDERRELSAARSAWKQQLQGVFERVQLIAMPTLSGNPPFLEDAARMYAIRQTHPVNLAGIPALALPAPAGGGLPASLQLMGREGSEELLLAAGAALEASSRPGV